MAVSIRLRRTGTTKRPRYRIVVTDSRSPRDGRFIESLGYYNPIPKEMDLKIDLERYTYWINVGAQPSETIAKLVKRESVKSS